jgi:hypothetical protein
MNKSELRECLKLQTMARWDDVPIDYMARSYSTLIRSARTKKSANQIMVFAAAVPAVVQHPEFITGLKEFNVI